MVKHPIIICPDPSNRRRKIQVDAWLHPDEQLAFFPTEADCPPLDQGWTIAHVPTGMLVAYTPSKRSARDLMGALADLNWDFLIGFKQLVPEAYLFILPEVKSRALRFSGTSVY